MDNWLIALLIKPFALLALSITVLYPATVLVRRYMTDGKLKQLLLSTPEERKVLFSVLVILFYVCFFGTVIATLPS